ncbi:hypothetical protein Cpir12675_004904, partial [Ceratocystis pirilliformis]
MASMGTEGERPRVLTYVQNEIVATLVPIHDGGHRDVVVVKLAGQGLHIANVYSANPGDVARGIALGKAQETVKGEKMVLCGDFNLPSHMWDSRREESADCNTVYDWMEEEDV